MTKARHWQYYYHQTIKCYRLSYIRTVVINNSWENKTNLQVCLGSLLLQN